MSGGKPPDDLALNETLAVGSDLEATHDSTGAADPRTGLPAAIGVRYAVDRVIGFGGMGTVYLARDLTLGRDVALKVHHAGSNEDRLHREALAMAQLAHPNVVTVYEVGTVEDRLFVAMEYVRGGTLRSWHAAEPRTWRDTVVMMLEVGEGLVAAHRVGLVHRDFKPENVLVGEDGRPRVSDFGLAQANAAMSSHSAGTPVTSRETVSMPRPISSSKRARGTSPSSPLTLPGTALGTPGYMSPEQHVGGPIDARADQFAFCIALWELLYGTRPFIGANLPAIQQAIERREHQLPATTAVPRTVQRVLARGLEPRPDDRHADMTALLASLRATITPRRRGWIPLAIAGVLAAGSMTAVIATRDSRTCDDASGSLDTIVPATLRTAIIAHARTLGGEPTAARVEANLAGFVERYATSAAQACRAADHGDWSTDLAARSRACLEDVARMAGAQLRSLDDGSADVHVLKSTTGSLPPLFGCDDPNTLLAMPLHSQVAAERDAIADARAAIVVALGELDRGYRDRAAAVHARIAASPIASRVTPALDLLRAHLASSTGELDVAIRAATDAYYAAHASADAVTEIRTIATLLMWVGKRKEDLTAVEPWYRLGTAEVARLERAAPQVAAELRGALAAVAIIRGELAVAVDQARLAVAAVQGAAPLVIATETRRYGNALGAAGDTAGAIREYATAATLVEAELGPDDISLAGILADQALALAQAGKYAEGDAVGKRALAITQLHAGVATVEVATVQLHVAAVILNRDEQSGDEAEPLLLAARETYRRQLGPNSPAVATVNSNLALIESDRGNYRKAVALLREVLVVQEATLGPAHPSVAATLYILAAALQNSNELPLALVSARRCAVIRATALPKSDLHIYALAMTASIENKLGAHLEAFADTTAALAVDAPRDNFQATAWPQLERARALVELRRDPAIARELLAAARTAYAANTSDGKRVAEIDALLARLAK